MTSLSTSDLSPEVCQALFACYQRALGHELPSRLVAVQGLLRLLDMEASDRLDAETRDYLTQAADLARRAHALTRELAELGRSIRNSSRRQPIPVGEAAREAMAESIQVARGQRVEYDIHPELDTLTVPWPGLVPVLVRLLHYLIHARPGSMSDGSPLRLAVGGQSSSEGVTIWVRGEVPTPPADRLTQFFDPFVLLPGVSTTPELGLFPVRLLVESWGGAVGVSLADGLTFTLVAPPEGSSTEEGHGRRTAIVPDRG